MAIPINVLIVENREADAELMLHELRREGFEPAWHRVDRESDFLAHLEPQPDVILAAYAVPEFNAVRALRTLQARNLDIPLIIVTGSLGDEAAAACMLDGATDYLLKDRLSRLGHAVQSALDQKQLRAISRLTEDRLRQSEEQYRLLFEKNPHTMWVFDAETLRFLAVNEAAVRAYGYSRDEFREMTINDIRPAEETSDLLKYLTRQLAGPQRGGEPGRVWQHRRKDGTVMEVEITANGIVFEGRHAWLVLANDVTKHRRLEERLREAHKMEAVGHLAGGLAHDFNNLLLVIRGNTELMLDRMGQSDPLRKHGEQIRQSSDQAASLVQQLLAFSRRQMLRPSVLRLDKVVAEMNPMLSRLLGEQIQLVFKNGEPLGAVKADRSQIEQVIINLAVNARDAMPDGGTLTIEMVNADSDSDVVEPGRYVLLAMADTGVGMSTEIQARLFEPFFTTKEEGRGTGLGLAAVYGIIKQSGGSILVDSAPGRGANFKIYLPRIEETAGGAEPSAPAAPNS